MNVFSPYDNRAMAYVSHCPIKKCVLLTINVHFDPFFSERWQSTLSETFFFFPVVICTLISAHMAEGAGFKAFCLTALRVHPEIRRLE